MTWRIEISGDFANNKTPLLEIMFRVTYVEFLLSGAQENKPPLL